MTAAGGRRAARLLLVALVGVVACTGDDDGASPSTSVSPAEAGVLRLGLGGAVVADPVDASLASSSDLMVIDLLHDGLTRLDADGVPRPALAAEWVANPARTAYRFRLAPEATFASGREVTATDVIASFERVLAAGDTSLVALSLESVVGFRAFVEGEAEHVRGLSAPDERTVRIALSSPLSVLPEVLSNPVLGVVDVATIEGDLGELDLSGAWAVGEAGDEALRLERRAEAPGTLEAVELRPYEDEEGAYDAFDDGEVDWASVPSARYEQAVADHGDDAFAPFHAELYFGMNVSRPPLRATALRQAVLMAIDREAIVEAVYADRADSLPTIVPAGVVGHDPDRCPTCAHDPEAAADIVEFAYPDGEVPTIHIDFDESESQQRMAAMVAEDLDEVGIPTDLRPLPLDDYKRFVVSGDQELFSFGWIGTFGSPDAYLAPLFGSAANDNLTRFRSAPVDGLLERAHAGTDRAENAERWAGAEERVLKAAVVVPIAQFRTQVVVADRVEGLAHAVDGTVDWAQVQLAD